MADVEFRPERRVIALRQYQRHLHIGRAHRVTADANGTIFQRSAFVEAVHAVLGRDIGRLARLPDKAAGQSQVDDRAG